jgi:hypothetical protein
MIQFSQIIPIPLLLRLITPRATIGAIYANAPAPFSRDRVHVRVTWAGACASQPARRLASVRPASGGGEEWVVFVDQLRDISAFVTWEI